MKKFIIANLALTIFSFSLGITEWDFLVRIIVQNIASQNLKQADVNMISYFKQTEKE